MTLVRVAEIAENGVKNIVYDLQCRWTNYRGRSVKGGEKKVAITGKISIEVKIRDMERLEETVKKCFTVTKPHPYAVNINIRVDETSLFCKLRRILRCVQRCLPHHLQKKDDK